MPADNILWFSLLFSLWQKSFSVGRGSGSCGQRCMDWGCHCDRWVAWLVGGSEGARCTHDYIVKVLCVIIVAVGGCSVPPLPAFPRLFPAFSSPLLPGCVPRGRNRVCCCGLLKTFTALKDPPTETNDAHPFAPAHPDRCSCSFSFSL